jgi:hypothetical protein
MPPIMPAGARSKIQHRRRGTAHGVFPSPLRNALCALVSIAAALVVGMTMLIVFGPSSLEEAASNSKYAKAVARGRAFLPGMPHNLRGQHLMNAFHPLRNLPPTEQSDKKITPTQDDEPPGKPKHEGEDEKREREMREDKRERQEKQHVRGAQAAGRHQPLSQVKPHPEKEVDLNPYYAPAKEDYPYPLEAVPEDFTVEAYTPLGGKRFTEYTTGGTPYKITDELIQRSNEAARSRRFHVKEMMHHAWHGYKEHAYGHDELSPQSGQANDRWGGQGITLVDSLDTLWLMGMKTEFNEARDWVKANLHHDHVGTVSVFETTIRDLGGLLSAFDWSKDQVFLDKALDLGERLLKAFEGSTTGIPFGQVDLSGGRQHGNGWSGQAILAEFATIQIENRYLGKMAKRPEFAQKTEHVFEILKQISPKNGLFPYFLQNNPRDDSGKPAFSNEKITFGAMADSAYEYMLKMWIQGGKTEPMYREMYDLAIDSMHKELLQTSKESGLVYIADKNSGSLDHKMDHLVCFMGGLLVLGAYTDPLGLESERAQRDLRTGKALTYTCYQMYARMNTGISPEFVEFPNGGHDLQVGRGAPHYLLRPEALESFFIVNYLTGDPIYREWGWEVWQSIEKFCKTDFAYGALPNVQDTSARPRDSMESFFIAETLKYLYLLFDPDTEVDILHKHVFNTEAHPTRIFPVIDEEKE